MDEDGSAKRLGGSKERLVVGVTKRFAIDVTAELYTRQPQFHAAFQLANGQFHILQRHCTQAGEVRWVCTDHCRQFLIHKRIKRQGVVGCQPVRQQLRHWRYHLVRDPRRRHLLQPTASVPA